MKEKLLLLCTCTYIEIMTAIGVTGYLLFLNKTAIAVIAGLVFLPLIVFHFIIEKTGKRKFSKDCKIGKC
jgi:hypothetical protein